MTLFSAARALKGSSAPGSFGSCQILLLQFVDSWSFEKDHLLILHHALVAYSEAYYQLDI